MGDSHRRHATRHIVNAIAFLLATSVSSPITQAATADEIDGAIARGRAYLLGRPDYLKNGNWELVQSRGDDTTGYTMTGGQWGGRTALITYALLASGVSPNDPRLRPAIDFLRRADLIGYYALGLRPQVWMYLPPTADNRAVVLRDYRQLARGVERDPSKADSGLYDYTLVDRVRIDLSVSQYGVLGMWACAQLGTEAQTAADGRRSPTNFWTLVEARWKSLQDKETGGWSYGGGPGGSGSMTAAGVATLFITQDALGSREGINCLGNATSAEIDRGIAFLGAELPQIVSGNYPELHYTLYGIERIGVASGLKYLNDTDWFAAGADLLTRTQGTDGRWDGDHSADVATSFSLLFLSRGREPVMMNKLKYDLTDRERGTAEGFWNERARDAANATRFTSRQSERGLNWQIVDLGVGSVRDLHDAPIVYLSGSQTLNFPPEQLAKLKQYVEEGGLLVFNADCGRRPFAQSAAKLMTSMFPGYEFRPLPDTSAIYRGQQFKAVNWKARPAVRGLSNGVRELALIFDDDAGKAWQGGDTTRSRELFELMADVYQYAIDKEHASVKGRTHVVALDESTPAKSAVRVARIRYAGNWDPEPGGWRQLRAVLRATDGIDVQVEPVDLAAADLAGFTVAHLTGTDAITLDDARRAKLKAFVDRGGLLLVDAAGGSTAFAAAVERELSTIVGGDVASDRAVLPATDPLYTADGKPFAARYRTFAQSSVGSLTAPRLRGLRDARGRWSVLYSPDDLSNGLVGKPVDGVRGYTPEVATDLLRRVLRYATTPPR